MNISLHAPHTWWWGKDPEDGCTILFPRMTLENLDGDLPNGVMPTRFRCVRCKLEGGPEIQKTLCTDLTWYHGDIREYRRHRTPVRCLNKACSNEWIHEILERSMDGRVPIVKVRKTICPACGSSDVEEIPS